MHRNSHLALLRRTVAWPARMVVCALLIFAAGGVVPARGGIITIDDFSLPGNTYQFFMVAPGTNPAMEITQFSSGALGGQRDTLINIIGSAHPLAADGLLGHVASLNGNALVLGTSGLAPAVATLQYSGTNAQNTSNQLVNTHALGTGTGVDLTNGGHNDRFLIHFYSCDAQPTAGLDVTITITSPGGKSSVAHKTAPNLLAAYDLYVPIGSLVGNASASHVDSVSFTFNAIGKTPNIDFEITGLSTVPSVNTPEPTSGILMLLACGILGCVAWFARRQRTPGMSPQVTE